MNASDMVLEYLKTMTTWPVVVLIFVLAFRKQLKTKLKQIIGAKAGSVEVNFATPKTVETVVGKINASAIPTKFESDSSSFRSGPFGFEISYPVGDDWTVQTAEENDDFAKQYKLAAQGQFLAFVVEARSKISDSINVNVMLQPFAGKMVSEYVAITLHSMAQVGWKLRSYEVDSATNGASFSYVSSWPVEGNELLLHHISRVIIPTDLGLAFLATATMPEGVDLPKRLNDDINRILNSFAVFKKAEHESQ